MKAFARTTSVLAAALERRAFSGVTVEVGGRNARAWSFAAGGLAHDEASPRVSPDTVFDLASLTKVLATTTIAARLVSDDQLDLETSVASRIAAWSGAERASVTLRDLLEHSSGLPAHRRYFEQLSGRAAFAAAIAREPLDYVPRSRSVYSDLGFILLGVILEDAGGSPLDAQFEGWRRAAGVRELGFLPDAGRWPAIAFTERDLWRNRLLQGEVHDENAAALGGVAGHAGLFGTAAAVGDAARWWIALLAGQDDPGTGVRADVARRFARRSSVPGSSRAIGWDTMLPTSSCGTRLSPHAIGHTGFTGTSLWIDPARDLYAVLLTNRVHPTRDNDVIQQVRRDFHDAVVADLDDE